MARKILLADDSVTAQNMGRKILADAGYDVVAVNNGSAALKKINETRPDLVVLDIYMPGYSGLEVCQRLKESPETARIPVLLTVGKLEPFKPEEARRVRAEGYIVKPFEASELLSALAKLEDKVVPRSEGSKPGRFARTIAAVEESGRTGRVEGEDSGWKNRISFPPRKTEQESRQEENFTDDPSTYNPMNRDLRTVVESPAEKAEHKSEYKKDLPSPSDEAQPVKDVTVKSETVDVGALAPAAVSSSLPVDVTQEEVAAIAAAAAQIKAATATAESDRAAEAGSAAEGLSQVHSNSDTSGFERPMREIDLDAPQMIDLSTSPAQSGSEVTGEPLPTAVSPAISAAESSQAEISSANVSAENSAMSASGVLSSGMDRIELSDASSEKTSEPVTMAATPESIGEGSRWSAVAVALDSEEASLSLEHEMQKASAGSSEPVATMATSANTESSTASAVSESSASSDSRVSVAGDTGESRSSGPARQLSETASEIPQTASASIDRESVPVQPAAEPSMTPIASGPLNAEMRVTAVSTETQSELAEAAAESSAPESAPSNPVAEQSQPTASTEPFSSSDTDLREESSELPVSHYASPEPIAETSAAIAEIVEAATPTQAVEAARNTFTSFVQSAEPPQVAIDQSIGEQIGQPESDKPDQPQHSEPPLDSEAVKNTAAAWASWRQIRDSKPEPTPSITNSDPRADAAALAAEAAKAVAAGAESSPHASQPGDFHPSETPADVASIVDSVLADLRPKLMQEISRKMAEKK